MQRLRRLLRQRSVRRADRAFVVEGVKIVEAALQAGAPVEAVYHAPEAAESPAAVALVERALAAGARVFPLQRGVMERVADTVTPQPICAVVGFVDVPLDQVLGASPLVVCVDVRDPGNLGAIVRSAAAAGAGAVVCCEGSADVYNPKTVRASAGALFHLPVVTAGPGAEVLDQLGAAGLRRVATVARDGEDYATADLSGPLAIVLGNEAHGLDPALGGAWDEAVTVPMSGPAESLNVAMTATVLCFEVARRARAGGAARPGRAAESATSRAPYDEGRDERPLPID